jgi:hypothetical protein
MPRDAEILRAFEIADDGMQGVIGYFHYQIACQEIADKEAVKGKLPFADKDKPALCRLPITVEWDRFYDPNELIVAMDDVFLSYHAQTALISIIAVFEDALKGFANRLRETQKSLTKLPKGNAKYKHRLEWAFEIAKGSGAMGKTKHMLTDCCLDIDHARRIRNLWIHNKGFFDDSYDEGPKGLSVNGKAPIIDPEYQQWKKDGKPRSVHLTPEGFEKLSVRHITLLHHVHDAIQRKHFNETDGYSYDKPIEWRRILGGV